MLLLLLFVLAAAAKADSFDALRLSWWNLLTGGTNYNLADSQVLSRVSSITNSALSYWNSMNKAPTRTNLWSDLTSTTDSGQIASLYSRLRAMALGYATYGSLLRNNAALAADIQSGLGWVYTNRYNATKTEYDNWYDWEIGAPLYATDLAVLMYDALGMTGLSNTLAAIEHFTPSPTNQGYPGTFTGANLADRIRIVAVRGVVVKDATKLVAAREALSKLFPYVTSGDGFYVDGSFIQHSHHPYTGSYGSVLLGDVSYLLPWLRGSPWESSDPAQTNVTQWVYNAFEPLLYRGAMLDMTRGRAISRYSSQDHVAGHGILQSILRLCPFAPAADTARMKSMVKYWALTDTYRNFTNNVPLPLVPAAEQLLTDPTPSRGELLGHWSYASMDQAVHLRPGWGFALSLSSSRVYNYEYMNGENAHGWFTGDGMTYLYNGDLAQFSDDFWPTVDPYRLPGTTVDTTARANGSGQSHLSSKNWVGGAQLRTNGVAGMELEAYNSSLTAKMSWFMFDNEVVCLGAGITCPTNPATIQTTLENRKLSDLNTNALVMDGVTMPATLGWSTNAPNVGWCALAGAGGYYFPGRAALKALRESRTNSWSQINSGGTTSLKTRNYLTLWFDHGVKPSNATYAYVLLPNYTAAQVSSYATRPEVTILANTPSVQAVKETTLNLVAANFWNSSGDTIDLVTCSTKAAVLTQEGPLDLWVAVADPTQTNTGTIDLVLNRAAYGVVLADPAITVSQLTPAIKLAVNVRNAHGRSCLARFSLQASPPLITAQPQSLTLTPGQTATFAVSATSEAPLTYQWRVADNPIAGATTSTFTLPCAQLSDAGSYSVVVSNGFGARLSSNATLTVLQTGVWGDNSFGQLVPPSTLSNVVAIAAGAYHNLALSTEGTVYGWGCNLQGQCTPPAGLSAVAIAAGGYHSLAIGRDLTLAAWGDNSFGQCNVPRDLAQVIGLAAGARFSLALRPDGTVVAWGDNSYGQSTVPAGLKEVTAVAAGGYHSLALKRDGTVVAWGDNTNAQGMLTGQSVVPPGLAQVVAIAAGTFFSLAVQADGTVVCWGDNAHGQTNLPAGLTRATAVAGGYGHALALQSASTAAAWGDNWNGQCALPATLSNIVAVAAGAYHSLVLLNRAPPPPRLVSAAAAGHTFSLTVQSFSGRNYALEFQDALAGTNWTPLPALPGNGGLLLLLDPNATAPQRFYRVRQW